MMKQFLSIMILLGMASQAQAYVREPWIQDVTQSSVTILWEADSAGGVQRLVWGDGPDSMTNSVDGELVGKWLYRATIQDLEVSSSATYQVESLGQLSSAASFVTAPCNTEPFTFVATGDNRDGVATHQAVVDAIAQFGDTPDIMINTGDIVDGTDYLEFFNVEKTLLATTPFFPAPGNHDDPTEYQYGFDRAPYYAYDYGNVRFVAINTDGNYAPGSVQYDWIQQELSSAASRREAGEVDWVIAYHHHPAFSSGSHGNEAEVISTLVPLYEQNQVDVILQGHDHHYERSIVNGIPYIVTGGGGVSTRATGCLTAQGCQFAQSIHHFTQVNIDGKVLTLSAIDTAGNVLDTHSIVKGEVATGASCVASEDPGSDKQPGEEDPPGEGNPGSSVSAGGCGLVPVGAGGLPLVLALLMGGGAAIQIARQKPR